MIKKLKIFLCDLTYDTIILVSDTIPINIGFIGSYTKKKFGEKVSIELFKYPDDVIKQIEANPPDIIGFSNYSWNSNLSEYVASIAKKVNPDVITVQGGTNFPHQTNLQELFLRDRPYTNFHTLFEGEKSFSNIVERIIDSDLNKKKFMKIQLMELFLYTLKTKILYKVSMLIELKI